VEVVCGLRSPSAEGEAGQRGAAREQAAGRRRSSADARRETLALSVSSSFFSLLHALATPGRADANSAALLHAEQKAEEDEEGLQEGARGSAVAVEVDRPLIALASARVAAESAPVAEGNLALVLASRERAAGSAESSARCLGERRLARDFGGRG